MGLFGKIKNIFYDEEIVEVPVEEEKRPEREPRIEEVRLPRREESVVREPVREQTPIYKEEPLIRRETNIPRSEPREVRTNSVTEVRKEQTKPVTPIYTERDLFKTQPSFKFPMIDEEDEPVKPKTRSSILDYDLKPAKREPKPEYKTPNKSNNSNISGRSSGRDASERTFKPSPVISPVYGVLDKNYTKEEIRLRNENIRHNPSDMNYDFVRRKAYGTLEDELESTLSKISEKKEEPKPEPVKEETVTSDGKSIEDLLNEIEGNRNMSIGEVEEQYKDKLENDDTGEFGFNFKVDGLKERIVEDKNFLDEEDEDEIITPERKSSTLDDFKTKFESKEPKSNLEETEGFEKTLEHDLFNLIDSMYEEREGE